jgi:predicted O-methyltransferase YrrM
MRPTTHIIDTYLDSLRPSRSAALLSIEETLRKDEKWGINIGSFEGCFLQFLIQTYSVKNILEIGTQYGYSTQWMLEALPLDGRIVSIEKNEEHQAVAKRIITDSRVSFLLGDALEVLKNLKNDIPFDLIFIDANKKAYPQYLAWAKTLVSSGGLIVGDNTFLFGSVFAEGAPEDVPTALWQSMRTFNEQIFNDPQFASCIIPTGEGLTVAFKK